ncbi:MAG: SPOR domain-containing protein [Treponema sp.]|jgi:DedD protein|nr:SPOR domain-containing protein [Treponema sp.]
MDKKKLLLVAVSVGIFLIIVIGLAILLFLPRRNASAVSSVPVFTPSNNAVSPRETTIVVEPVPTEPVRSEPSRTEPASANPVDMLRNPEGIQGLQPPPAPSTMTQENNIYIYGDPSQPKTLVEQITRNNSSDLVIEVPKPSTVAAPGSVPTTKAPPRDAAQRNTSPPTAPAATTASPGPVSPKVAAKPPASKAPIPQTRTYESYWVQAGAFSTVARAEGAKKRLADKGITAIIENRDVKGQNVYRVRVGPFTTQNEADYWLSQIKKIPDFEGSQIRQSPVDP